MDHEFRQKFGCLQSDVSALGCRRAEINSLAFQFATQTVNVCEGRDDNCRTTAGECRADVVI
jgi:hypothetical protein